jgi:lipopolysaccharide biosynthesis glycosyltransferase
MMRDVVVEDDVEEDVMMCVEEDVMMCVEERCGSGMSKKMNVEDVCRTLSDSNRLVNQAPNNLRSHHTNQQESEPNIDETS